MSNRDSQTISTSLLIIHQKVFFIYLSLLEKKEALETFLEPVTVIGLNMLKDELSKKMQEKLDMEAHINNLQNQIKDARNMIEVIDLGNKLVFKEYQKMGNENNV